MAVRVKLPPGPRPALTLNNMLAMRRDMLGFFQKLARTYGDIVYVNLGPRQMYLVSDPELIKDVLVTHSRIFIKSWALQMARQVVGEGLLTSEGDFHRRQRRLIQPVFHRQRIQAYGEVMSAYAGQMGERWRDGQIVDIQTEMMRLTLAVAGKTLFDADVESEADEIGKALTEVLQLFVRILTPFSEILNRLPLPSNFRFLRARARLDETIYRLIRERRESGVDRGDLLSMLLAAQDEDDKGVMTDRQVRDEALTLFLAGHETTAVALTWTWYLLSQNPEAEAKLHMELDEVLDGRLPSVEDLPRLEYARKVLTESMRLFPPAYTLGREGLEDYPLREYVVPAGAMIIMSQFVVHRDGRHYKEPERFIPERWTPEFQEALPRFAYYPFGGGPRVCIGESFAWMESTLLLAALAQKWSTKLVPGHPVALRPLITLRPKHGMRMVLRRRRTRD